jgi:hypothetical protein
MKSTRRNFLRLTGLAGLGLAVGNILKGSAAGAEKLNKSDTSDLLPKAGKQLKQKFNMSGHAAPRLDTVRIGFIGLGNRGPEHVYNMSLVEGVDIKVLCEI